MRKNYQIRDDKDAYTKIELTGKENQRGVGSIVDGAVSLLLFHLLFLFAYIVWR